MGTTLGELEVKFTADSAEFERAMKAVQKSTEKFGESLQQIGGDLTKFVTLPLAAAGVGAVAMAAQEEAASARMVSALKNVGIQSGKTEQALGKYFTTLERLTGFNDTDVQDSFTDLVNITGNARSSFDALSVVTDLAVAKNMDLHQASVLVGRAMLGQTDALKRYGITLRDGASAQEVLTELTRKFGGAAEGRMSTIIGLWLQFKNQISNAAEAFGVALFPAARAVLNVLIVLADYAKSLAEWFGRLPVGVRNMAVAVGALVAAIGPLLLGLGTLILWIPKIATAFQALNGGAAVGALKSITVAAWSAVAPIALLALKVALLLGVFTFFYSNGQKIASGIASVFTGAFTIVLKGIEMVLDGWAKLTSFIPFVGDKISKSLDSMKSEVKIWSDAGVMATKDLANGFVEGGGFIENTINQVKGWGGGLLSMFENDTPAAAETAKQSIEGLKGSLGGLGPVLDSAKLKWQEWSAQTSQTVQSLATSIHGNFVQLGVDMVTALATGQGNAAEMLKGFLLNTLKSIASWAITNLAIMQKLSAGIAAALANPWVAFIAIAGLIGAIAALSASFAPSTAMAEGGITNGPTTALLGDNPSGKEAVIPLDSPRAASLLGGGGAGEQTIIVELDGKTLTRAVVRGMPGELRVHGILRS